jgi:hypothetical protein
MERLCKHCGYGMPKTVSRGFQCNVCRFGIGRYGLNRLQQIEMLEKQNNKCKLCNKQIKLFDRRKSWSAYIDHDHRDGRVRGILCHPCNTALGYIENANLDLKTLNEYICP